MSADDVFGDRVPAADEPFGVWVDFAVSRGFKRSIVKSMSKSQLMKALDRLESSYDDTVYQP